MKEQKSLFERLIASSRGLKIPNDANTEQGPREYTIYVRSLDKNVIFILTVRSLVLLQVKEVVVMFGEL